MKKAAGVVLLFLVLGALLISMDSIGSKMASITMIYTATAAFSFAMLAAYWMLIRKKDPWFILLFSSVFIVNTGYLALALSKTLEGALWANRLSYLGSVFLPLSMLMIILNTCKLKYPKFLPGLLCGTGALIFMVAASPGILDIYYQEVSIATVNGITVLEKVYGPWHSVYLLYLLGYTLATVVVILHACTGRNMASAIHAIFMSAAVFVNVGVWLLEQLVRFNFELLSVSYIVSEMFLLLLCLLMQCEASASALFPVPAGESAAAAAENHPDAQPAEPSAVKTPEEQCAHFAAQRAALTPTERAIYHYYLEGKSTKEILSEMNIKENTLKYHNKNIYSKLGVSSRKQLLHIASLISEDN